MQVLASSWGTAVAPQHPQGVGGMRLAPFPDREQQLFAPTAQHQLNLVSIAADLPKVRSRGQGELPPALALQTEEGQVDRRLRAV